MTLKWIILNVALPMLVVLGVAHFFLRRIIAMFFKAKAAKYLKAAEFPLANYPRGTFGYEHANLVRAMGELYANISKAFHREAIT